MSLRSRLETFHLISPAAGWPIGTTVLVPAPTPPSRERVAIYSGVFSSPNATRFAFAGTDGTPINGPIDLLPNTNFVLPQNDNFDPWYITPSTTGLSIVITAGALLGDIYYLLVPGDFVS